MLTRNKRIAGASIISLATVLALTACGSQSSQKTKDTSDNKYGYDEPITLNVGTATDSSLKYKKGDSSTHNQWTELYKKNGFKLKYLYSVDTTQAAQKLSTAIASGTYPDVFGSSGANLKKYSQSGVIADLTSVYKKYATKETKEYYGQNGGEALKAATIDGKLYGLPQLVNGYASANVLWVRQDWLDKLGLKAPTTTDELMKVAEAFTKDDPDGNGKNDTYGLIMDGKDNASSWSGLQTWFECYGQAVAETSGNIPFLEKDGKLEWGGANVKVMEKALTDLNSMYKAGTLGKSFASVDMNAFLKEVGGGKAGMYFAPYWGADVSNENAYKNDPKANLVAVKLPDGNGKGSAKPFMDETPSNFTMMSAKSNNPEALIKLANLSVQKLVHPKGTADDQYLNGAGGTIGWKAAMVQTKRYDYDIDNYLKVNAALNGKLKRSELNTNQKGYYDGITAYLTAKKDGTLAKKTKAEDPNIVVGFSKYNSFGNGSAMEVVYNDYLKAKVGNFQAYTTTPSSKMVTKYATLTPMTAQTLVKIISGSQPVSSYAKFVSEWKSLGGTEATKEAQAWYDKNN